MGAGTWMGTGMGLTAVLQESSQTLQKMLVVLALVQTSQPAVLLQAGMALGINGLDSVAGILIWQRMEMQSPTLEFSSWELEVVSCEQRDRPGH